MKRREADSPQKTQVVTTEGSYSAYFAGGCFWCMEPPFEKLPGVIEVISGYMGGQKANPTYEEVSTGKSGHVEAIQVIYDPSKVDYAALVETFWMSVDPTDPNGQFADQGSQYTTAIFYSTEQEKTIAEKSKQNLAKSGRFQKPIVTPILPSSPFYPAEQYHQDYYQKKPEDYKRYRVGSGRAGFLKKTWGQQK